MNVHSPCSFNLRSTCQVKSHPLAIHPRGGRPHDVPCESYWRVFPLLTPQQREPCPSRKHPRRRWRAGVPVIGVTENPSLRPSMPMGIVTNTVKRVQHSPADRTVLVLPPILKPNALLIFQTRGLLCSTRTACSKQTLANRLSIRRVLVLKYVSDWSDCQHVSGADRRWDRTSSTVTKKRSSLLPRPHRHR